MLTRDEHLKFCQRCTNRQFDAQQGLICKLTGKIADFDPACPNFQVDETVPEVKPSDEPVVVNVKDIPEELREAMRKHQDMSYAIVGGLAASIVGAMIWGAVTYFTHYQIGYLAIGVGLLVAFAVRYFGAGIDLPFGVVGAVFAVFGCVLGNLMSQIAFMAEDQSMTFFEVIPYLNWSLVANIYKESFSPMDFVFYGFAGYEGYRFAFRPVTEALIRESKDGTVPPIAHANLRLPLVAGLFVVLSVMGYLIFRGGSAVKTTNYESGKKHYAGMVVNGLEQGPWTFWYENGEVQQTGYFKDGNLDSLWEYFNEDGTRYRSGSFFKGMQNGEWTDYYPDGQASAVGLYSMGRMQGPWSSFHENGKVRQRGYYSVDRLDSLLESFSSTGTPLSTGYYREGIPNGPWTYWYEDGKVYMEVEYVGEEPMHIQNMWTKDGKQVIKDGNGAYTEYYSTGEIMESGRYAQSTRSGSWRKVKPDGKMLQEGEYRSGVYFMVNAWSWEGDKLVTKGEGVYSGYTDDGESIETGKIAAGLRQGVWVNLSEEGDTLHLANYSAGKLNGRIASYNGEGSLAVEGEAKEGAREGEWKWYHPNSQLESSVIYLHGKKQGDQAFFDEDGAIIRTEVYSNGKLKGVRMPD